ncbi:MAG: VOC family protein [Elusimicrobiota bacterium]
MTAKIPEGFQTATIILAYKNCPKALAWYEKAFGAKTRKCLRMPSGQVVHAELVLGTSLIVLTDELPFAASKAPRPGCLTSEIYLYVPDCDDFVYRAATHIEDVSPGEYETRMKAWAESLSDGKFSPE